MIAKFKSTLVFSSILAFAACGYEEKVDLRPKITTYGEAGINNSWPKASTEQIIIGDNVAASNYYVIVDGSGSMRDEQCSNGQSKMSVAKSAVKDFINGLPSEANVGVYGFDAAGSSERHSLSNNNRADAIRKLDQMRASGGTPLGQSVSYASAALSSQARKQLGYGEYHLVVVTDGAASDPKNLNLAINGVLSTSPIVIHTVGFCIGRNHTLNRKGYTLYHAADNPESLVAGLQSVLAEAPEFDASSFSEEG